MTQQTDKQSGTLSSYEMQRRRVLREYRSFEQKMRVFLQEYAWILLGMAVFIQVAVPAMLWPSVFSAFIVYVLLRSFGWVTWDMDCPDVENAKGGWYRFIWWLSAKGKLFKWKAPNGDGIVLLGWDKENKSKALWVSMTKLATHVLLMGTTGGGKTQVILGFLSQIIARGSGAIFVDGKADITTWFFLYTICRMVNREDDLLVINYLTAGQQAGGKRQTKNSNTTNPFAFGTSESLMEMLSSLMGEAGSNDGMWRGRAVALASAVLRCLCEKRDRGELVLSVSEIRDWLPLERVEELEKDTMLSEFARASVISYLDELPGYRAIAKAANPNAAEMARAKAHEQHGYLAMQFTEVLEMLGSTYAHIMRVDLGEIDFRDVILNRRILYIMLPSMEKSPESLKNLGRMAVTAIRNALTVALGGDTLTGERRILSDARPTNTDIPFAIVLDEYGSYAVEGFGDVAAQARSLGVTVWFCGQDYPSFKKGSEIEAERVDANTGIKVFLKTENAATADLLIKRAGKSYAAVASGVQTHVGEINTTMRDRGEGGFQEIDRVVLRELAAQKAGEAHVVFGDNLWRMKMFYPDIKQIDRAQVNSFLRVRRPTLTGDGEPPELARERKRQEWLQRIDRLRNATEADMPELPSDIAERYSPVYEAMERLAGQPAKPDPMLMGPVAVMHMIAAKSEPSAQVEDEIEQGAVPPQIVVGLESGHKQSVVLSAARQALSAIQKQHMDPWKDQGPVNLTEMTDRVVTLVNGHEDYPQEPLPDQMQDHQMMQTVESMFAALARQSKRDGSEGQHSSPTDTAVVAFKEQESAPLSESPEATGVAAQPKAQSSGEPPHTIANEHLLDNLLQDAPAPVSTVTGEELLDLLLASDSLPPEQSSGDHETFNNEEKETPMPSAAPADQNAEELITDLMDEPLSDRGLGIAPALDDDGDDDEEGKWNF